jgi:hypothetical protein
MISEFRGWVLKQDLQDGRIIYRIWCSEITIVIIRNYSVAVFSYNAKKFLASEKPAINSITKIKYDFILSQQGTTEKPFLKSDFAIYINDDNTVVDYCWFVADGRIH